MRPRSRPRRAEMKRLMDGDSWLDGDNKARESGIERQQIAANERKGCVAE